MDNIILFLILFIFIILLSNHSIEGFEVDTCNMNDKINTFIFGEGKKYDTHKENLKEEVIQGQIEENIQSDDKEKEEEKEQKEVATIEIEAGKIPRTRPTKTSGVTRRIRTGEGTLYITINEDENGLCEVFTTIGKAGGNAAAQSEAISRFIFVKISIFYLCKDDLVFFRRMEPIKKSFSIIPILYN